MKTKSLDFLQSLVALPTPSGWESDGMRLAADYLADVADSINFDLHGNLHAVINAGAETRVMLALLSLNCPQAFFTWKPRRPEL